MSTKKWLDKLTTLSQVEGEITTRRAGAAGAPALRVTKIQNSKPDDLVKSQESSYFVIPVKTGIQCFQ